MCKERNLKKLKLELGNIFKREFRVDKCMVKNIKEINKKGIVTLGCCCGHGKYPMTIVYKAKDSGKIFDLISGKRILRKRRFYIRDKQGYYYIPETLEDERKIK